MNISWNKKTIQQYIDDKIQESLVLDYKAAESLQKKDEKKKEITKDVSAMANSAGGIILYGVKEYKGDDSSYFPEQIDPVDQSQYTKEWLQQIINTIRPKIDGLIITPVQVSDDSKLVVYVIEIPQSTTAHQATDYRYYKRYNALSIPMEDYEIRDVMGRLKNPTFDVSFNIIKKEYEKVTGGNQFGLSYLSTPEKRERIVEYSISIYAQNVGSVVANYVNAFFHIPSTIVPLEDRLQEKVYEGSDDVFIEYEKDNTVRDIVDVKYFGLGQGSIPKYGPSRYDPILPKLGRSWSIQLDSSCEELLNKDLFLKWEIYADNANQISGEMQIKDIVIEQKSNEDE